MLLAVGGCLMDADIALAAAGIVIFGASTFGPGCSLLDPLSPKIFAVLFVVAYAIRAQHSAGK